MPDRSDGVTVDVDINTPDPAVRTGKVWIAFHERAVRGSNVAYYADLTTALDRTARWYWRGVYGHITKPVAWHSFAGGGLWQLHDGDGHTGVVVTLEELCSAAVPATGGLVDTGSADEIRGWLDRHPDAEQFEFPREWLAALLAERDQLAGERGRYRTAWRVARTRARSAGAGADMYAKRSRDLHEALMGAIGGQFLDLIAALTAPACETDDYGNCATHGVLALEPGAQCPHVIARELLKLIQWPAAQPDGSR